MAVGFDPLDSPKLAIGDVFILPRRGELDAIAGSPSPGASASGPPSCFMRAKLTA